MATLNYDYVFTNGTTANAIEVNDNFDNVKTFVESSLVHVDGSVKAGSSAIENAAITETKLANDAVTAAKVKDGETLPVHISGNASYAATAGSAISASDATSATNARYLKDEGGVTRLYYDTFILTHAGYTSAHILPTIDNSYVLGVGFTGNSYSSVSAYTYYTSSDRRAKTDVKDSVLGLDFVKSLRPISYKWIVGGRTTDDNGNIIEHPGVRTHYGFLAQEVKEAVDKSGVNDFGGWSLADKNDPLSKQSLSMNEFIAPMVKAIQELSNRVDELEAEVKSLKND